MVGEIGFVSSNRVHSQPTLSAPEAASARAVTAGSGFPSHRNSINSRTEAHETRPVELANARVTVANTQDATWCRFIIARPYEARPYEAT
jgi:hypothetical protein